MVFLFLFGVAGALWMLAAVTNCRRYADQHLRRSMQTGQRLPWVRFTGSPSMSKGGFMWMTRRVVSAVLLLAFLVIIAVSVSGLIAELVR